MGQHAGGAAAAADDSAEDSYAATDRTPPGPSWHISHVGSRMLRLLGLAPGQRDAAGDFELLPSADADAGPSGKEETPGTAGAHALPDMPLCTYALLCDHLIISGQWRQSRDCPVLRVHGCRQAARDGHKHFKYSSLCLGLLTMLPSCCHCQAYSD